MNTSLSRTIRGGLGPLVMSTLILAGCAGGSDEGGRQTDAVPAAEAVEAGIDGAGGSAEDGPRSSEAQQPERGQTAAAGDGGPEVAGGRHSGEDPAGWAQAEGDRTASVDDGSAVAKPAKLTVPAIDVHEPLIDLGLNDDGSMEVPDGDDFDLPGWYEPGPKPGEDGNAVIAGHVDNHTGPSVFIALHHLEPGDEVAVEDVAGSVVTFVVDRVEMNDKGELPTDDIFGRADEPRLRLITCGGDFNEDEGSYTHNVVVYADHLDGPRVPD